MLLRACGARLGPAAHLAGARRVLRNGDWLGWAIVLALLTFAITWWSYRRVTPEVERPKLLWLLTALRVVLFALLLLILLRPVLAFTVEGTIRRQLLLLVDGTASMKIQDPRFETHDIARAAMARGFLDFRKGLQQPVSPAHATDVHLLPRVELLQGVLKSDQLDLLRKFSREYDVSAYSFGSSLAEIGGGSPHADANSPKENPVTSPDWVDRLNPVSQTTAIGDAVRDLLERKRGQRARRHFPRHRGRSQQHRHATGGSGGRLARSKACRSISTAWESPLRATSSCGTSSPARKWPLPTMNCR